MKPTLAVIAAILIILIALPQKPAAADPSPQSATVGCLIITVAIGVTVVWGLIKICNRCLPPNTNAPATNTSPTTNPPPVKTAELDQFTNVIFTVYLAIESCSNLAGSWIREGYTMATIGDGYITFVTTNETGVALTNITDIASMTYKGVSFWAATNDLRSLIHEQPGEQQKFWRLVQL